MIPGDSGKLNRKGVTKQIKEPVCVMPECSMKANICPQFNITILQS